MCNEDLGLARAVLEPELDLTVPTPVVIAPLWPTVGSTASDKTAWPYVRT